MDSAIKEKIKCYMNVHEFITDKRLPTDEDWEKYFIQNYNNNCQIEVIGESFITYDIFEDHIFIKDFVSFGQGHILLNKVIKIAKEKKLPIRALVHKSNEQVLDIITRRFRFNIVNIIGNQYLLEKE